MTKKKQSAEAAVREIRRPSYYAEGVVIDSIQDDGRRTGLPLRAVVAAERIAEP